MTGLRRSARLLLVLLLAACCAPALAGPLQPARIRAAGAVAHLDPPALSDGRETYLPLQVLTVLGATHTFTRREESVVVHAPGLPNAELAVARPRGVPMVALSDLARALRLTVRHVDGVIELLRPGEKPTPPPAPKDPPKQADPSAGQVAARTPDPKPGSTEATAPPARPVDPPKKPEAPPPAAAGSVQPKDEATPVEGPVQPAQSPDGAPTRTGGFVEPPPLPGDPPSGARATPVVPIQRITGIAFEPIDERRARLTITGTGRLNATTTLLRGPSRLAVDIPYAVLGLPQRDWSVGHQLVSAYHALPGEKPNATRVVLDLERLVGWYATPQPNGVQIDVVLPRNAGGQMQGAIVVVDPGHGAGATGCSARVNGKMVYEKNLVLDIGRKLQHELAEAGANCILTRSDDTDVSLSARPAIATRNNAHLFVSIHIDDCPRPNTASGTTVYYHRNDPNGRALAHSVVEHVARASGLPNRGARSDSVLYASGLAVLRKSTVPAVLVEVGYINHARDRARLMDPAFRSGIAAAICSGVRGYIEASLPEEAIQTSELR